MKFHSKAIFPRGFKCASIHCGLKKEGNDLSVFYTDYQANAAGVFTQNKFPGAPVILGRQIIKRGCLRAIIVNSKISNVGTGEQGIANARRMAAAVAHEFGIPENEVIMSSTGVIGVQLPIEKIESGIVGIAGALETDPLVGARGIMTTDTHPKAISMSVGESVLTIVAKGSGMIEPNMATMLVYIFSDADIASNRLDDMLRNAVRNSFNMLSVDSDTSTSDTCLILANSRAGNVDEEKFATALNFACTEMAKILARDGEGATKLLIATVTGAKSEPEARIIAKAIINSPLVKTMAYGADPNIGRILMAVGKCTTCDSAPEKIEIEINEIPVFANLCRTDFDEIDVRERLSGDEVKIHVKLNIGAGSATAFGCDLTEGYIEENAAYYSS
ncbi:bifunctional glutamate N-acetyltransferase/amino-acid acetyltransferase ArgJ [candidate division KSB1 bacterium]|nr:bifunctional glutamate N-acetyltransferase/amino-acid acetyltransferase ArgJ [candidate division KSB1 bacterium]